MPPTVNNQCWPVRRRSAEVVPKVFPRGLVQPDVMAARHYGIMRCGVDQWQNDSVQSPTSMPQEVHCCQSPHGPATRVLQACGPSRRILGIHRAGPGRGEVDCQ